MTLERRSKMAGKGASVRLISAGVGQEFGGKP